ncbi:hypothetical protein [Sphingomonas alpina]|uniref:Uncharacterized protein n=1 Tax=Sphingomonas alpina TaxID=653931 RepID=A0A7H0LKZ2_9SPHN|nr:hypothetical protein [Sphingomonas alpina]QNQ10345.1 hypothetical protein H3Z74_03655 [Sphingomonas alpina]
MQNNNDAKAEQVSAVKEEWLQPEIVSVTPITEARGLGGAGIDFASEQS